MKISPSQQIALKSWYLKNKRDLPWRNSKDAYFIWLSEIMLQQTNVQTVIPYFSRFKERFPNITSLSEAPLSEVIELWSGLGYYSRARNLHKAAKAIVNLKYFPQTYQELLPLPGFGDYTARAVSSIAFDESVGVVDGNVIRILSRLTGNSFAWWQRQDKMALQKLADQMVLNEKASLMNQAMMELGATLCTPTSPGCPLCPWLSSCKAQKQNRIQELPIKRPKKTNELLMLNMNFIVHKDLIALTENETLPFLKNSLFPPVKVTKLEKKPKQFQFQHSITHYKIFVKTQLKKSAQKDPRYFWHSRHTIKKVNPSSILQKALKLLDL